jgi:hypothetical protein
MCTVLYPELDLHFKEYALVSKSQKKEGIGALLEDEVGKVH